MDPHPPLPRPPDDPANLQRLREEAARRMAQDERRYPAPVYGGAPVMPRRSAWKMIVVMIGAAITAIAGWFVYCKFVAAPVYGGPPAAVYGGPVVQDKGPDPKLRTDDSDKAPEPKPLPSPPAAVYGAPPPRGK